MLPGRSMLGWLKPMGLLALPLATLACPPERTPLPAGPPPEYETPRAYEPQRNIDSPDNAPDPIDAILEDDDPPAPSASAASSAGTPDPAASGSAAPGAAPSASAATTAPPPSPPGGKL